MSRTEFSPSPAQLRAFVNIADFGSFTAAAAQAKQSQSALSQAISALEQGLGVELFRRAGRQLELSAAGLNLIPAARTVLASLAGLINAADPNKSGKIAVNLGIIPTAAPYVLPGLLSGFWEEGKFAPVVVEDRTRELLAAVQSGLADIAVVALPLHTRDVAEFPLYREDFVVALPPGHPLASEPKIYPEMLDNQHVLLLDTGHCLRDQTLDLCRQSAARILGPAQSRITQLSTAVRCVAAGLGIAVLPQLAANVEAKRAGIITVPFDAPVPARTMGLIARESLPSELVKSVSDLVARSLSAEPGITVLPAAQSR